MTIQVFLIKILKIYKKILLKQNLLLSEQVSFENAKIALDDTVVRSP